MLKINVVKSVLEANHLVAESNRRLFKEAGLLAINFISSPGSGKTTLLDATIQKLLPEQKTIVVVGDLETTRDAERLAPHALQVTQINTGMSCHLYASQVAETAQQLDLKQADYLFIENVGNMVCPGEFDLGENLKVVLLSLPEGDDKVAKYPTIFRAADLVLLSKVDLKGVLNFNVDRIREDLARLHVGVPLIEISASSGQGMSEWVTWLRGQRKKSVGIQAKFIPEE